MDVNVIVHVIVNVIVNVIVSRSDHLVPRPVLPGRAVSVSLPGRGSGFGLRC